MAFLILCVVYSVGCYQVLRLAKLAGISFGVGAAAAAILANVVGALFGVSARALAAVPVVVLSAVATSRASVAADDYPRDSQEERHATKASQGLLGLAVAEALMILTGLFVWMIAGS